MKIPMSPPPEARLLAEMSRADLPALMTHSAPLVSGKYLHWDELRHRTPPAALTLEQWWLAIWLSRNPTLKSLPLLDKHGHPFRLATPEPALIALHHIDRDAAGQIRTDVAAPIHENRDRYLLHSLIEESITSSQLEGASTTRRVAEAMLREGRKPRDHGETMIFNNYHTMEQLRSLRDEPLTPDLILELHRMLTLDTLENPADAGHLRRADDVNVVDNRDGTILHQPPRFKELPERLERLCAFANADEDSTPFVHPVIRAILLHFMVGYDHPFVDGNGRTARALFYWSMARSDYWLMEFLSISQFLKKAPAAYVQAYLHTETDNNDTTYFALHQLAIIQKAIASLHTYLGRKMDEQRDAENLLIRSPGIRGRLNHRQLALLTYALKHPGELYRVATHQATHNVVYQTARSDLLELERVGFLDKMKQGNAFVFFAPDNLHQRIEQFQGTA